jgi:hypothetical protein
MLDLGFGLQPIHQKLQISEFLELISEFGGKASDFVR